MDPVYEPIVRPADLGDAAAVRAIRNDAIAHSTAIWTGVPQSPAEAEAWMAEHVDRGSAYVVEHAEAVVGYGCWGPWREKEGYRFTVEDSIYLRPGHHGRGLGRALLSTLVDSARTGGAHVMIADIESGNVASIRLHQRLGFEVVGTLPEVGTKFDRWLDLTIMRRRL